MVNGISSIGFGSQQTASKFKPVKTKKPAFK